jgi:hypothetical protein
MDLSLQSILVEVALCIEAAMEPTASCRPTDICCRWCVVTTEVAAAVARPGGDVVVLAFATVKVVVAEVLALAHEGCL